MRIVDINLMPYEIEVSNIGYTLLKIGVIESEGKNNGLKKETTMGYYGKSPASLETIIHAIAHDQISDGNQKMNLTGFLTQYNQILLTFRTVLEKVLRKVEA